MVVDNIKTLRRLGQHGIVVEKNWSRKKTRVAWDGCGQNRSKKKIRIARWTKQEDYEH